MVIEVLYIILLLLTVTVLVYDIKARKNLLRTVFFATFILYYILTPAILGLYDGEYALETYKNPYLVVYVTAQDSDKYRAFLITLFAVVIMFALRKVRIVIGGGKGRPGYDTLASNEADYAFLDQTVFKMGMVFLIIGGVALVELTIELGGLRQMLSLGSIIRGYRTDNADYLSAVGAVCKTLSVFVTGSFFCFYSADKKTHKHRLLTIFSFILSIIYLMFNAGRGPLLLFIGCILFAICYERGKKVIWIVILGFLVVALLSSSIEVIMNNIAKGLPVFSSFEYNMADNILATVTDLAYPYANLLSLPKMVASSGYNYGLDYLFWFSEVVPKRLFSAIWSIFPSGTLVTTKVTMFYISSDLSIGGTPADFITYGWFQGHIFGLLINCLIYDAIIKFIDKPLALLPKRYSIIRFRTCFFVYSLITSNDLPLMVKNNLFLIIIILVLFGAMRKRAKLSNIYKK